MVIEKTMLKEIALAKSSVPLEQDYSQTAKRMQTPVIYTPKKKKRKKEKEKSQKHVQTFSTGGVARNLKELSFSKNINSRMVDVE